MDLIVSRDVMVPMRDGCRLATDIWMPAAIQPRPALLLRMAVDKDSTDFWGSDALPRQMALLDAGYVVVRQSSRGNGKSEGVWNMMGLDADDGEDMVEWITQQPWSDGSVGGFGPSHMGIAQWAIASTGNANYKCLAPAVTPWDYYRYMTYNEGGVFQLQGPFMTAAVWGSITAGRAAPAGDADADLLAALSTTMRNLPAARQRLPLSDHPEFGPWAPWWGDQLDHPSRDDFWQQLSYADKAGSIIAPALNIGGWFDTCLSGTLDSYETMCRSGGSEVARSGQRLIIGPWDHISYAGIYPSRSFGGAANIAQFDITAEYLRFYDRWLRGNADALDDTAPVKIFVMGLDRWRDEPEWPLRDTIYQDFFLTSGGTGDGEARVGALRLDAPSDTSSDSYVYDPRRPVPSLGGPIIQSPLAGKTGPVDQRAIEARDDVLCYTTEALEAPIEVTGWLSVQLYFESSAQDTDIAVKLVDVYPDGRALYVTDGILRARYRNSLLQPELLEPGKIHEIAFRVGATSNLFKAGHKIRIEITSSNYPRYSLNGNSGKAVADETEADMVVAVNRVHHGGACPSRLILPVIRRGEAGTG